MFIVNEAEEISRLIGDIYDASLDAALWAHAFERIRDFLGDCTATLISQNAVTRNVDIHFMLGHDQHYIDLYLERYFKINPLFPPAMFSDVERTQTVNDLVPLQEFCRSRFAREWLAPQGIWDSVFSTVEKSAIGCTLFMTMRRISDGSCDDDMRRRFGLILPHVRRSLLIGNVIDRHKVEAAALADSLDTLASAMFIVNETGRIIHANASGYAMVAEAKVLRAPDGRLTANDPATDQALLDIFTAAGGGDAALGRRGVAVPLRARDNERYVAHVLPLTSGARRKAGISYGAVAAIFVRKAAIDMPSPPVAIAQEFQLTPAELRVLFSIVEIGGASEVAEVLGITEATVRSHLHRLFEKTGTGRQADLVKLVAGYCVAP
jgi:DNA-binding CsgD family transcriptional regulator